jgi:uncharacterized protein involved in response to NO
VRALDERATGLVDAGPLDVPAVRRPARVVTEPRLQIELGGEPARAAGRGIASHPLFGRAFRPFFLAAGLYAPLAVTSWLAVWLGALPAPRWLAPAAWHGHEMLFGVVAAAIAGFLLTAAPVWTGRTAPHGAPLAALFALYLSGRLAMLAAGVLPAALVAGLDLAFLPSVALVLARTVWRSGQWRNYGVVALVAVLALANAAVHAEALGAASDSAARALRFAADGVVVLIVVIGGRITPAFTTNALQRAGVTARAESPAWLGVLAVGATALVAALDLVAPRSPASGLAAAVAALAIAARMAGWQTLRTCRDPLVWSLHAGMAWVAVGLGLVAAGDLGAGVAASAGLHALTAGAMGSMILAVMTRVSLGHTGRALALPRGAAAAYGLVHAGTIARIAATFVPGEMQSAWLAAGGLSWAAAFALFAALYAPILWRPRIDGKEG